MKIISPITKTRNVKLVKKISVKEIINNYLQTFKIDVSKYFKGLEEIELYRCMDSLVEFYYPFNIFGDSKFYEQLQKIDWYYTNGKWEHKQVLKQIKKKSIVLEIGCAEGAFLYMLKKNGIDAHGIEINQNAINIAKKKGFKVINSTIEEHAKKRKNFYDCVCSFQVMEHIQDLESVFNASLKSLKVGGLLIFSVPNNDSFISLDEKNPLNMPPHHMCLWNEKSLIKMQNIFNIKLKRVLIEPLQKQHFDYYKRLKASNYDIKNKLLNKLAIYYLNLKVRFFSKMIKGHSVIAIYEKI